MTENAMLAVLTHNEFQKATDEELIWLCVEPVVSKIRGKSAEVKLRETLPLNRAQQALLMLQILRGHSRTGVMELFASLEYLMPNEDMWKALRGGALYFHGDKLAAWLEDAGRLHGEYTAVKEQMARALVEQKAKGLNAALPAAMAEAMRLAAAYIRGNPVKFVALHSDDRI